MKVLDFSLKSQIFNVLNDLSRWKRFIWTNDRTLHRTISKGTLENITKDRDNFSQSYIMMDNELSVVRANEILVRTEMTINNCLLCINTKSKMPEYSNRVLNDLLEKIDAVTTMITMVDHEQSIWTKI